jgi:general secretion pathway protein A
MGAATTPSLVSQKAVSQKAVSQTAVAETVVPELAVPETAMPEPVAGNAAAEKVTADAQVPMLDHSNPANWRWPEKSNLALSQVMAFQALFKVWGLDYDPRQYPTVCRFSRSQGLGCLSLYGSMATLRQLNRPAVLKLFNAQGQEYYVTLVGIEGERALLEVGGQRKRVRLKDLELWWLRSYTLLWREPPDYQVPIRAGARGPAVVWLDQQLAILQGRAPRPDGALSYDEGLVRQVQQFQRSQGLVADAVIGPRTSIRLNTATMADVPLLMVNPRG